MKRLLVLLILIITIITTSSEVFAQGMMGSAGSPQVGGGGNPMMGYGNFGGMMGGFGVLATIFWIVLSIDLVLLGVWLWKQIQKK